MRVTVRFENRPIGKETVHGKIKQGQLYYSGQEMSFLRTDKMRPLYQEVSVALPVVQFQKSRWRMKDMNSLFILIPYGPLPGTLNGNEINSSFE